MCRDAVLAAVQPGMAGPVVDLAGAMALATAAGVPGPVAAALVGAGAEGVVIGYAEKRAAEAEAEERDKAAGGDADAGDIHA